MKCDVCGSDNLEGAAYCEDCGAKLVVAQAVAVSSGGAEVHAAAPPPPQPVVAPPPPAPVAGAQQTCSSCGAENPDTEQYCVDCGASLGSTPPTPTHAVDVTIGAPAVTAPPPPVAAGPTGRLVLTAKARDYKLNQEITTIGRRSPADQIEPDIDLTDDDPDSYVSRRHAQILHNEDHYIYEDVGSSNGSFINNVRCQPGVQHILKDSDNIRVGKTEFVFHAA